MLDFPDKPLLILLSSILKRDKLWQEVPANRRSTSLNCLKSAWYKSP